MPRDTRLIIPDVYHHALQRGNNRQDVFHDYKLHPVAPELYHIILKNIEMNPVRAGLVSDRVAYPWSSASYRLLGREDQVVMADGLHRSAFSYRDFFCSIPLTGSLSPEKGGGPRSRINRCDPFSLAQKQMPCTSMFLVFLHGCS